MENDVAYIKKMCKTYILFFVICIIFEKRKSGEIQQGAFWLGFFTIELFV